MNAPAVVADAIASAGTAASGILQAEQAKKAEQKAKEDAASKAVDDAQLELDLAQSTLAFHIANNAEQDKIVELKLAVQAAVIKLSAAQTALARLRGVAMSDVNFQMEEKAAGKAVDDAESELAQAQREFEDRRKRGDPPDSIEEARVLVEAALRKLQDAQAELAKVTGLVFGPKLFAIREEIQKSSGSNPTSPYLQIVPVRQQADSPPQEGWNPSQPMYPVKWPDAPKPPEVRIFPEGVKSVPDQSGSRVITLQVSVPLVRLVRSKTRFEKTGAANPGLPPFNLGSPTVIEVDLRSVTTPGDYTLQLAYQTRGHTDPNAIDGTTPVQIKIVR